MKMSAADATLPVPLASPRSNGKGSPNGRPKLNKVELLKLEKSPLGLIHDIYRWADEGFDAIPAEYYDLFKWHGFFYRKQTPRLLHVAPAHLERRHQLKPTARRRHALA